MLHSYITVPLSSCSSSYATIPFFNTAKATVPRLAAVQSFEWVLFAMVDGEYEHLLRRVAPRRSEDPSCAPPVHLNSTYTSKSFALCMFRLSSESITLQLAKTQCLTDGRDCSGSNFVLIHGYYRRARVTTVLHSCMWIRTLRFFIILQRLELCGPSATSPRTRGGKVNAHQRLHY
jgi:hypothetical protein